MKEDLRPRNKANQKQNLFGKYTGKNWNSNMDYKLKITNILASKN